MHLVCAAAEQAQHAFRICIVLRLSKDLVAHAYQRIRSQHHPPGMTRGDFCTFGLRQLLYALGTAAFHVVLICQRGFHHKRDTIQREQLAAAGALGSKDNGLHKTENLLRSIRQNAGCIQINSLL